MLFETTSGIRAVFEKPVGTGFLDSYGLWLGGNGILSGAVADTAGMGPILSTSFSLIPSRWYHLAYTFDHGTKRQVLYVDGVQVAVGNYASNQGKLQYVSNAGGMQIRFIII